MQHVCARNRMHFNRSYMGWRRASDSCPVAAVALSPQSMAEVRTQRLMPGGRSSARRAKGSAFERANSLAVGADYLHICRLRPGFDAGCAKISRSPTSDRMAQITWARPSPILQITEPRHAAQIRRPDGKMHAVCASWWNQMRTHLSKSRNAKALRR